LTLRYMLDTKFCIRVLRDRPAIGGYDTLIAGHARSRGMSS
jgi:hypothetical protein